MVARWNKKLSFLWYGDLIDENILAMGRGGGLVVSVLAFYSDDPSLIPAGYLICTKRQI